MRTHISKPTDSRLSAKTTAIQKKDDRPKGSKVSHETAVNPSPMGEWGSITNNVLQTLDSENPSVSGRDSIIQTKKKGQSQGTSEASSSNQTGLPNNLKAGVENLSGYSLDDVRVHYNSPKPAQLQAHAYTQGTNIHVAPKQEQHLPHEAWHVVQQMQGRVKPTTQMKGVQINDNQGLEREADLMGEKAESTNKERISHQSSHLLQQSPVFSQNIQRAISGDNIKTDLGNIQGLQTALNDADALPQGITLDAHITRMIERYEQTFEEADNAMQNNAAKIALIVRALARDLALKLNNPWLAPEIGQHIVEYYGQDLVNKLNTRENRQDNQYNESKLLAQTLASADPVMLYMSDKLSREDAAQKIALMAQERNMQADDMYVMLARQFQVEIGTFTQQEINTGRLSANLPADRTEFSGENDLIGEISPALFAKIADLAGGNTQWDWSGLQMTEEANQKLVSLRQAVSTADVAALGAVPDVQGRENLSDVLKRYLYDVEQAEGAMNTNGLRIECIAALRSLYGITIRQADRLINDYVARFNDMPLTITTFRMNKIFGAVTEENYDSALKRERQMKPVSEILPTRQDGQEATGEIEKVGRDQGGMSERRNNPAYIRWRYEKDVTKPPGYGGLGVTDLPEFGALSPSFDLAQGSEDTVSFGQNQYGTSHFVLKPAVNVRVMYQLTAKGPLRRNPIVLLHDILVGADRTYTDTQQRFEDARATYQNLANTQAERTPERTAALHRLQEREAELGRARTKHIQALNVSHALMSFVTGGNLMFLDQQQIETQIFGGVNIRTDVDKIVLGNDVPNRIKRNARAFAQANNIEIEGVSKAEDTHLRAVSNQDNDPQAKIMVQRYVQGLQQQWVPTAAEWKRLSSTNRKRSALITDIGTAVANYDQLQSSDPQIHLTQLQAILDAIQAWQDTKNHTSKRWQAVVDLKMLTMRMINMIRAI